MEEVGAGTGAIESGGARARVVPPRRAPRLPLPLAARAKSVHLSVYLFASGLMGRAVAIHGACESREGAARTHHTSAATLSMYVTVYAVYTSLCVWCGPKRASRSTSMVRHSGFLAVVGGGAGSALPKVAISRGRVG